MHNCSVEKSSSLSADIAGRDYKVHLSGLNSVGPLTTDMPRVTEKYCSEIKCKVKYKRYKLCLISPQTASFKPIFPLHYKILSDLKLIISKTDRFGKAKIFIAKERLKKRILSLWYWLACYIISLINDQMYFLLWRLYFYSSCFLHSMRICQDWFFNDVIF